MRARQIISLVTLALLSLTLACPPAPTPTISIGGDHRVEEGDTITLTATTADGEDSDYTWSSDDAAVATVSDGTVVAAGEGVATITATGVDTEASASHVVVVVAVAEGPAPTVAVSGGHRVVAGETLSLSAMTANGTDAAYTWSSDDADVATVSGGTVTGVGAGEATITATGTDTGASAEHVVVVIEDTAGTVAVLVDGPFYVAVGTVDEVTATTLNGTDTTYTWESSDEAVATVSAAGVVRGVGPGTVTLTATGSDTGESGSLGLVVAQEIPFYDAWLASGHADRTAEAFIHWDEDGEVPTSCARCHSEGGYRDYLGDDGTPAFQVDNAAPLGTVVSCAACHNGAAADLDTVEFPSGNVINDLGPEARCMTCHQGRSSGADVDADVAAAGVGADETSTDLGFVNIHYYAAGATLYAGRAAGGYEYADGVYDTRFRHVPSANTCIGCHNQHSLEIRLNTCQGCHDEATTVEGLKDIRMISSGVDYDGDNDLNEGIYYELTGLRARVLELAQAYATQQGTGICYSSASYPYFFQDTNGDGECGADEANYGNRFTAWTPRLLKGAYNFQVASVDPGAFAHNAKYIIQLLYDSAQDLNAGLTAGEDLSALHRQDEGHFNGAGEAARHWDDDNEGVSASCSRCHGGSEGLRFFLQNGVGAPVTEPDNGLDCYTCHQTFGDAPLPSERWSVIELDEVTYPGGATIEREGFTGNLCATCHQGRESKATIDATIATGSYSFRNVHYLPAGGVAEGTNAQLGYEYDTKTYSDRWLTHPVGNDCVDCHSPVETEHTFHPNDALASCQVCHGTVSDVREIRLRASHVGVDFDGDADTSEPLPDEIATLAEDLLAQIQTAASTGGPDICYDTNSYPYWFQDSGSSTAGVCAPADANYGNRYPNGSWTPALMKAAHNFQISQKDPGAWAHNFDYMAQLLIDSIDDLGGAVGGYTRPAP